MSQPTAIGRERRNLGFNALAGLAFLLILAFAPQVRSADSERVRTTTASTLPTTQPTSHTSEILEICKVAAIIVTLLAGIFAVFQDTRKGDKLTLTGKVTLGSLVAGAVIAMVSQMLESKIQADSERAAQAALQRQLDYQSESLKQIARAMNPLEDMTVEFALMIDAKQLALADFEARLLKTLPDFERKAERVVLWGNPAQFPDRKSPAERSAASALMPSSIILWCWTAESVKAGRSELRDLRDKQAWPELAMNAEYQVDWPKLHLLELPSLIYFPRTREFRVVYPSHPLTLDYSSVRFSSLEDFDGAEMWVISMMNCAYQIELTLTTKRGKVLKIVGNKNDDLKGPLIIKIPSRPWN